LTLRSAAHGEWGGNDKTGKRKQILSFTFTPEPGDTNGTITFNGTTQSIGAGNLSIAFPPSAILKV
jgi:hypothetical protein